MRGFYFISCRVLLFTLDIERKVWLVGLVMQKSAGFLTLHFLTLNMHERSTHISQYSEDLQVSFTEHGSSTVLWTIGGCKLRKQKTSPSCKFKIIRLRDKGDYRTRTLYLR